MQNTAEILNDESTTQRDVIFHKIPFFFAVIFLCALSCPPVSTLMGAMGKLILLAIVFLSEIIFHGFSDMLNVLRIRVKEIVPLLLWVFVLLIYRIYEIGDIDAWVYYFEPLMYFIMAYLIGALYLTQPKNYRVFVLAAFLTIGITCLALVRLIYENPLIVRITNMNEHFYIVGKVPLIGSISYYTGIALLTPFIFGLLKFYRKNNKIFFIIVTFAIPIFLSILLSTMLASFMIFIIGLVGILYLTYRYEKFSRKKTIVISAVLCVSFIMFFSSDIEQSIYVKDKIDLYFENALGNKSDQINRSADALKSIDSFSNNPLFGIGPTKRGQFREVGEHSTWLDALTEFGIIGFLPFILFLYFAWLRIYTTFRSDPKQLWNQVCVIAFLLYLISGLVNPWGFGNFSAVFFAAMVLGHSRLAE